MTAQLEIRKCGVCETVIEVLESCGAQISCCGRAMERLSEKSYAAGRQRHIPVVEQVDEGVRVTVGLLPHPMNPEHSVQWIELIADGRCYRQFLRPGMLPEATFELSMVGVREVYVRLMCNQHGLWSSSSPLVVENRQLVLTQYASQRAAG